MKRALLITWAFAAAVALLNIGTLWPLIVTPLALLSFTKWMGFLFVPLAAAALGAVLVFIWWRNPLAANLVFWITFFIGAEYRHDLHVGSREPINSRCSEQRFFTQSLLTAGHEYQFKPHAVAVTSEDRVMLWSYAEMDYFEIAPNTYRNLDFTKCRSAVQASLEKTK